MRFIRVPAFLSDWLNRLSIVTKVTLVFSVLILVASATVGFLVYQGNSQLEIASSRERLTHTSQVLSVQLASAVKGMEEDIKLVSKNPVFSSFIQSLKSNSKANTSDKKQINSLFRSLLESRSNYLQVSFILADSTKKELVRIEQLDGTIKEATEAKLGTLNGHLFFEEAPTLQPEKIYVSAITLFRTGGELRYPFLPTLKAALPVYAANAQLLGVLIITNNLTPTFNHLETLTDQHISLYLTNQAGDYLIHPDKEKIFGFEKGNRWMLQTEFPESRAVIYGKKQALQLDEAHGNTAETMLLNLERLYIFNDYKRFVILGVSSPYIVLLSDLRQVRNTSFALTIGICLAGMLLTLFFARFLIRPLQHITQSVSGFASGNKYKPLAQKSSDEVGVLTQAFNQMATQIQSQIQELAYKEQSIRTIIETTIEAIIILNKNGIIEQFNQAAETIFGYPASDIIGQPITLILPEHAIKSVLLLDSNSALKSGKGFETLATRRKDEQFHVYLALSVFEVAGEIKYTGIIHDISERKKVEAELLQAKQLAEQANITKDEFLSVMSHEIRTPMNAVIGMTRVLLQNNPQPQQLPIINTLKFSADNLMALLNDVLDFSKIQAGKIEFEETEFNVVELLTKIIHSHQVKASENGVQLRLETTPDLPEYATGDPVRLFQIINNLVSNAVKFTPAGAVEVKVSTQNIPQSDKLQWCFEISDTGIGITPERLPFIFERFTQGSSDTNRKYGGSGLGLAITKNLSELMGGSITVGSNLGQGSTFRVYLPLKPATKEFISTPISENQGLENINQLNGRILYIEDVVFNQFLIQNYLAKTAIILDIADNAPDGIALVKKNKYDLILMDIQMPEMDGFQATEIIRTFNTEIPIIALTALTSDKSKEKIQAAGLTGYIGKPVDQEELLRLLTQYLQDEPLPDDQKVKIQSQIKINQNTELDISELEIIYDHELLKIEKALSLILTETSQYLPVLQAALHKRDELNYAACAHKIKPNLQLLKLERLGEILESGRKYIITGDGDLVEINRRLKKELTQLTSQLEGKLKELSAPIIES